MQLAVEQLNNSRYVGCDLCFGVFKVGFPHRLLRHALCSMPLISSALQAARTQLTASAAARGRSRSHPGPSRRAPQRPPSQGALLLLLLLLTRATVWRPAACLPAGPRAGTGRARSPQPAYTQDTSDADEEDQGPGAQAALQQVTAAIAVCICGLQGQDMWSSNRNASRTTDQSCRLCSKLRAWPLWSPAR
jgi:hypothetical protein